MTVTVHPHSDLAARAGAGARSRAELERELFRRYNERGDSLAREQLVEMFLPLARQMARRYERASVALDDLVQVASLGLLKAIDRFEPAYRSNFASYAVPTIAGELKRYLRDASWAMHVPRGLQEHVIDLTKVVSRLSTELGRSPTTAEIAAEMGISSEQVLETREAANAFRTMSLEAPEHSEGEDGSLTFLDRLGHDDEHYELVDYAEAIRPTFESLSAKEREALRLRFREDLTQSEIGERIGVSQMQVSRLLRAALGKLREVAQAA